MVNCSPQLPESPNTADGISYRATCHKIRLLTDEAEVVAGDDVGDGHVDLAVAQVKVASDDDRGLNLAHPQEDEARRVRDLRGLVRSVPAAK